MGKGGRLEVVGKKFTAMEAMKGMKK